MRQMHYEVIGCDATKLLMETENFSATVPGLIFTDPPYCTDKVQAREGGSSYYDTASPEEICHTIGKVADHWMGSKTTLAVICDYRLAFHLCHYLTELKDLYLRGEIIWEFGLGKPRESWWPNRHNHILTFTTSENGGIFDKGAIPRTKRIADSKGYPDDKPMGSVWDYTFSNSHPERVKYPNQKPSTLLMPFVLAHTNPDDLVIDPFCGSGSTGVTALKAGRKFLGSDTNPEAVEIANERLKTTFWGNWPKERTSNETSSTHTSAEVEEGSTSDNP